MSPIPSTTAPLVFSLREQIADRIRTDVICGRLGAGERLNEVQLGKKFGVSRTPIRAALQQLLHEGILEGRPNVGLKVAKQPSDAMYQLVTEIRRTIESFAGQSLFISLTDSDFANWNAILERMRAACLARDFAMIAELDIEFHRSIVRRAHEKDLESIWSSIVGRVRAHFRDTQKEQYPDAMEIYEEHVGIIQSFKCGDVKNAVALLKEKIC
ncbi:MAG: GntR family transcriptional regulator [Pirellulaceae bacterium]|nr:GntR family transcriptional regulator [Pirellulaceae bacterium]